MHKTWGAQAALMDHISLELDDCLGSAFVCLILLVRTLTAAGSCDRSQVMRPHEASCNKIYINLRAHAGKRTNQWACCGIETLL